MGNSSINSKPNLISNQVFEVPQDCSEIFRESTGEIIYANGFSGINSIPMPNEYRQALNNDYGEVGLNVIMQLKQKVQQFPDGPWYVDSKDGILYIHNKKLNEPSRAVYTYQGENGELLSASFETQYITKNLHGSTSSGIGLDKGFSTTGVGIHEVLTPDMSSAVDFMKSDGTYDIDAALLSYSREETTFEQLKMIRQRDSKAFTDEQWNMAYKLYTIKREQAKSSLKLDITERYESYKANEAKAYGKGKKAEFNLGLNETLTQKDLSVNVMDFLIGLYGESAANKQMELDQAAKDGTLEDKLKSEYSKTYYTFTVDHPKDWGGASVETYDVINIRPDNNGHISIDDLRGNPNVVVLSTIQNDGTVKAFAKSKTQATISGYKLLSSYYSHKENGPTSSSSGSNHVNALVNNSKTITEKKLSARVTVIGRPSLATSQIVTLLNIGKRWSGRWYIKTCTHNIDPNSGYTTLMELVKHDGIDGHVVVDNNGTNNVKSDKEGNKDVNPVNSVNLTTAESIVYGSGNESIKEDLLILKLAGVKDAVIPVGTVGNLGNETKVTYETVREPTKEERLKYGRAAAVAIENSKKK